MIFYFTGTGNSLAVAKQLSTLLHEELYSIPDLLMADVTEYRFDMTEQKRIVFVFPIHSWGVALPVNHFIERLTLVCYTDQPIYAVSTCGDDCGRANDLLRSTLRKRSLRLTEFYSVVMPNNYILMKGFDVDNQEVAAQKLKAAPPRVGEIAQAISQRTPFSGYTKGKFSWLKSYVVYPLFAKFAIRQKGFRYTDGCIGCGLCEKNCPTHTISMHDGRPLWGEGCVQCTACIHRCPTRAIEFADISVSKGRYCHPDMK